MTKYDGKPCPVCSAKTRRKFIAGGKTTKSRSQHARFWVCERGHALYRKQKGQLG